MEALAHLVCHFRRLLCDVDVEEADRVALELLLRRLDTFDVRQAADTMAL